MDNEHDRQEDAVDVLLRRLGEGEGAPPLDNKPEPEPVPGSIDRFEISDRIGEGGMGVVYRAFDTQLDRYVALKLINTSRAEDDTQRERLQKRLRREARAMARCKHQNVVAVYEVGDYGEGVYLVMDLVSGSNLHTWLTEGPRPWREIVARFIEAGRGLEAAHAVGLVHRDFKPDNVLIDERGAQVTDFGLASDARRSFPAGQSSNIGAGSGRSAGETFLTSGTVGTPAYMAPEQWQRSNVDARADQYSFCLALFEAVYGQRPSQPEELAQLAVARRSRPAQLDSPPARLWSALARGLEPEPDHRWLSMVELLAELEAIMSSAPSRRTRALRWLVGGLAAAAAVVLALWSLPQTDSDATPATTTALRRPQPPPPTPTGWSRVEIPPPASGVFHFQKGDAHVIAFDMRDVTIRILTGEVSHERPDSPEFDILAKHDYYDHKRIQKYHYTHFEAQALAMQPEQQVFKVLFSGTFATEANQPTPVAFGIKHDNEVISFGYGAPGEYQPESEGKVKLLAFDNAKDCTWIGPYGLKTFARWPDVLGGLDVGTDLSANKALGRSFVGVRDRDDDGEAEFVVWYVSKAATQAEAASALSEFQAREQVMLCGGDVAFLSINGEALVDSDMLVPQVTALYVDAR